MAKNQDPDDHQFRPLRFYKTHSDGSTEKTFAIHESWMLAGPRPLGELVVWETKLGPLVKITIALEADIGPTEGT
jgi:hypothetical protein